MLQESSEVIFHLISIFPVKVQQWDPYVKPLATFLEILKGWFDFFFFFSFDKKQTLYWWVPIAWFDFIVKDFEMFLMVCIFWDKKQLLIDVIKRNEIKRYKLPKWDKKKR